MKKKMIFLGGSVFLLVLYFIFPYLRPFKMEVQILKIAEKLSPDGKNIAVLYSVDGGATSSHNVYVRLMKNGEKLDLKGNSGDVFGVKMFDPKIEMTWVGNGDLKVKCSNCSPGDVFVKKGEWLNVLIKYE